MKKSKIRVGIIGAGFGRRVHLPAWKQLDGCEVLDVAGHESWKDLVRRPDIDVVSIAVPPLAQSHIALAAIQARKGVFCEKPLSVSLNDARKLLQKAQEYRVAHVVDFEFQEIEAFQKAKLLLDRNALGKLRHVHVAWHVETYAAQHGLKSWKTNPHQGGGVLSMFACHTFYYLEWMFGKIKSLRAELFNEHFSHTLLRFENKIPAAVSISTNAFLGNGHRLEFYGDKGTMVLENKTRDYAQGFTISVGTRQSPVLSRVPVKQKPLSVTEKKDGRIRPVSRLMQRFLNWVRTGTPEKPSFREALRVQFLIEKARSSHQKCAWVSCRGRF